MHVVSGGVELLEWDSGFFGFPIGQVVLDGATGRQLDDIDAQAADLGLRCLYGSLDPAVSGSAALAVQDRGFRFVEAGVVLERPEDPFAPAPSVATVREGTQDDLVRLSWAPPLLAPWSRFGVDPGFGPSAACRMFTRWIERAAVDDDRLLLVAEAGAELVGLATAVRAAPDRVDLMAVDGPGEGAAQLLLRAFVDWAGPGPTEGGPCAARNIAAIRFLEGAGYRIRRTRFQYHRWFDDT
jgi:hypothetical protein